MSLRRRTVVLVVTAVALSAACSGDEDTEATTTTAIDTAAAETTLVDPPNCDELADPVDASSLEGVGCLEQDGVVAIATTADCPDEDDTVVFISDQMGLEGGEWVDADEGWESLCP